MFIYKIWFVNMSRNDSKQNATSRRSWSLLLLLLLFFLWLWSRQLELLIVSVGKKDICTEESKYCHDVLLLASCLSLGRLARNFVRHHCSSRSQR